jgi:hypothetical protein
MTPFCAIGVHVFAAASDSFRGNQQTAAGSAVAAAAGSAVAAAADGSAAAAAPSAAGLGDWLPSTPAPSSECSGVSASAP